MKSLKSVSYSMLLLLLFGSFAPFVAAEAFNNPMANTDFNSATNNWQSNSPTFDDYYRGSTDNYWPILKNLENDQCDAVGSDFVVMIPPGGCSPAVVRSDLLAEQNVPVFCQLSAIRVNPLIDVSTIKSISFKGDYPEEVAGISFHPARAAVSSRNVLLGSPVEENIGYVVIVLKKQPDERNLTEYIKGMLTATIKYDAQGAFGTGAGEYYLGTVSDSEWENNAVLSSFWGGKGYLRVKDINSNSATIEVLTAKDKSHKTVTLEVGETSSNIYYPGQYCTTALKVKLNKIDDSKDMAKINIDGDIFWVREGSKLFDEKCEITKLNVGLNGSGDLEMSCSGNSRFRLILKSGENELSDGRYVEASNIPKYTNLAEKSVLDLVDNFPAEKKENGEYWGEDALYEQIMIAGTVGNGQMQIKLIDRFLEEYPGSANIEYLRDLKLSMGKYDYSEASQNLFVNNNNYNIRVDGFVDSGKEDDSVEVRIGGGSIKKLIRGKSYNGAGVEISGSESVAPRLTVMNIDSSSAEFNYVWKDGDENPSETFSVDVGEYSNIGGMAISVVGTNVREVAYISLIPEVLNTKTEANFTFNIGVEKRMFELSPEKAQEKLEVLNESINEWEDRLETLGKWIKGLKGACFATSSVLTLKSMVSGFSGASLARGAVMDVYEAKCREEGASSSIELHKCYSENSNEIEEAIEGYGSAINAVNEKVKCAKTSETVSDDFFGNKVVNTDEYVSKLASCTGLSSSWVYKVEEITIRKDDLRDASDYRAVLLKEEVCKSGENSDACEIATKAMERALSDNLGRVKSNLLKEESKESLGTGFSFINLNRDAQSVYYKVASQDIPLSGNGVISKDSKYAEVNYGGGNYIVTLGGYNVIEEVYEYENGDLRKISDESVKSGISGSARFIEVPSSGDCSNLIASPYVRYYESQNRQGFAAVVPFDINNGWYTYIDAESYTENGVANAFWICNVGNDGIINDGVSGGDLCARFSVNAGSDILFTPCPSKSKNDVTKLYSKAESAIREANRDGGGINIDGQYVFKTSPLGPGSEGVECTDFMSVDDCNLMFNVCDPVICPASRCDLGGKFPVADVISTGIIGSSVLCLPNFGSPSAGGVLVPICLSGIHAGIDSYLSILKSYRSCLEKNIETGEYVGICDEISAVYMCEFFWGQLSPVLDTLLPRFVESMIGGHQIRGGAEYLTVQKSFDNLDKSINYFTSNYAKGAFRAFDLKNTEEIGSTICKGFVGSSVPTSFDFLDSLTEPESPTQFYAHFSEDLFSEATVPSTSHYRVYYHIYAGNDAGVQYKVYLRNPPESSYYANRQSLLVDSGYAVKGVAADESIDFTAPTGYKELCVDINGQEECGFSSVTSSFALDYVSQSYIADQANDREITRTEDCVTTSTSGWGMVNLNVQEGVEKSIGGEDITTSGIVRICASANPEQRVVSENDVYCESDDGCGFGYTCKNIGGEIESGVGICENENGDRQVSVGRWVDVGYCDSESVRCWIDSDSVEGNLDVYMATNDMESINEIVMESKELKELKEGYKSVRAKLNGQKKAIGLLEFNKGDTEEDMDNKIESIISTLDGIIGIEDEYVGQGTNANKAEALNMKAGLYIMIVGELLGENPEVKIIGGKLGVESDVGSGETEENGWDSKSKLLGVDTVDELSDNRDLTWETNHNMRTDRHNNPTAFIVDLAEQAVRAGSINKSEYSKGDSFEGSSGTYYTARLNGDAINITIRVIDSLGFYTKNGQQRWVHTAMSDSDWSGLKPCEKANVIKVMYYREGGDGLIFKNIDSKYICEEESGISDILFKDIREGNIIKNKADVEYEVTFTKKGEDNQIIIILQNIETSKRSIIRDMPDSLLKNYGDYGYSVVSD